MRITAKELSKLLNLSEAAVSMALNNKPGVSTQTRVRVIDAAKKYGYDFSKITEREITTEIKETIVFIIYRKNGAVVTDTPFFSQLTEGISKACKKHRYYLNINYIYESDNIETTIQEILQAGCKGVILLGTEMNEQDFKPFSSLQVPIVLLDCYFDNIVVDTIMINNSQGAYLATNYLIGSYKCQPGYLHSSYPIQNFHARADGYYKSIRANGMSTSRCVVHHLSPSMEGAYSDMVELLQSGEQPVRTYFADNDLIAAGAVRALKEYGYLIPKDVAIIGFDDTPLCTYIEPSLSTIQVPKQYMGEMAVLRLTEIISDVNSKPTKIEVYTSFIKRKSC